MKARDAKARMATPSLRVWITAVIGLALALGVAACGSSSDSDTSGGSSAAGTEASSGGSDYVAEAKSAVAAAEEEVTGGVPTSSPPVAKDKFVVLIPCAAAAEGCSEPMAGAAAAAKAIGWKTRTIDGKGTPADEAAAIEQAIALKPDAIIMHAIDPETVKGAVKNAEAAGIPVLASSVPESDLVAFSSSPTRDAWEKTGADPANFLIAETDGKAKYIQITNEEFGVVVERTEGFEAAMEKCTECEKVATASFTFADMATKLPQLTQQLLQTNPDVDSIWVPFDAAVPFVLQGMQAVGKDLLVVSADATSEALSCIRDECGQSATGGLPVEWIGWTDIDAANRLFNNADPMPAAVGLPAKLITPKNVQQEEGTWNGDVDYQKLYEELWNVG